MVGPRRWAQPMDPVADGPEPYEPPAAVVNLSLRPVLLTLEEAAQVLRIGRTRMFALVGREEVRSVRIGGSRRVPVAALEDYVERLLVADDQGVSPAGM